MKTYIAKIKGISPYSQSKAVADPRGPKETHDDHEKRTWRDRLHANDKGNVIIPPMALKNCMAEAAKYRSPNPFALWVNRATTLTLTHHFRQIGR